MGSCLEAAAHGSDAQSPETLQIRSGKVSQVPTGQSVHKQLDKRQEEKKRKYLERVFDAVSRLSDADGLQHSCVSELSEHQTVVEAQRQLSETVEGGINRTKVEADISACLCWSRALPSQHWIECISQNMAPTDPESPSVY